MTTEATIPTPDQLPPGGAITPPPAGGAGTPPAAPPAGTTPPLPDGGLEFKNQASRPNVEEEGVEVSYEYTPTGDAGLDLALDFVGRLGFSASHPAMLAAQKGDFTELDKALAAQGDKAKGYKNYLAVAQNSYKQAAAKVEASKSATLATVHDAVGGKESWDKVAAFVSQHATDDERSQIDAAFRAGGLQAKAMASNLNQLYQNSLGQQAKGKSAASPDKAGGGASAAAGGALSPREYAAEMDRLSKATRGNPESHAEYASLRARAVAYRR